MAYSRTTWSDDVTPLSAANLNNIETGILALESEKISKIDAIYDTVAITLNMAYTTVETFNKNLYRNIFFKGTAFGLGLVLQIDPVNNLLFGSFRTSNDKLAETINTFPAEFVASTRDKVKFTLSGNNIVMEVGGGSNSNGATATYVIA